MSLQLSRIPHMIVRADGAVLLILGILLWTGKFDAIQPFHIALGIILVLSLFWLAAINYQNKGSVALSVLAFLDGVALYFVGVLQQGWLTNGPHWLIQVLHLLLGVFAIGLGEMIATRLAKMAPAT
jgi:energy-coupling factor transporter transmembrane protein EcfT